MRGQQCIMQRCEGVGRISAGGCIDDCPWRQALAAGWIAPSPVSNAQTYTPVLGTSCTSDLGPTPQSCSWRMSTTVELDDDWLDALLPPPITEAAVTPAAFFDDDCTEGTFNVAHLLIEIDPEHLQKEEEQMDSVSIRSLDSAASSRLLRGDTASLKSRSSISSISSISSATSRRSEVAASLRSESLVFPAHSKQTLVAQAQSSQTKDLETHSHATSAQALPEGQPLSRTFSLRPFPWLLPRLRPRLVSRGTFK